MRLKMRRGGPCAFGILLRVVLCAGAGVLGAVETAARLTEQALARKILDATGTRGGLIVHIGCGDGKLTAALRANDSYLVHGLDTQAKNVRQARQHIRSLGSYEHGKVSIDRYGGERLPYVDNLVNLVVSEDLGKVPMKEVMRVLCPGGVAYIKKDGKWTRSLKPRPEEIDEWTHFLHDADNNAVAQDSITGPPHHLQWVAAPKWARSHDHLASVSALVSSGGRIFSIVDQGSIAFIALPPKWTLVARDAFNGVVLWKRPLGPWEKYLRGFRSGPSEIARRLIAQGDRVYVTLGYGKPVCALDAATGKTIRKYEETGGALEFVCRDGVLFVVVGDAASQMDARPGKKTGSWIYWPVYETTTPGKHIVAIEAATGKLLWKTSGTDTAELMPTTLAAAGGRVFFQNTGEIVCLDAKSGREQWRAARPVSRNRPSWSAPTLVVHNDVVLSADRAVSTPPDTGAAGKKGVRWIESSQGGQAPVGELIAFSAKTGQRLWSSKCRECYNAPVDVLVADGLVWSGNLVHANQPGITEARDVTTGEVKRRRPADGTFFHVGMSHHRCHRNKATCRYLVLSRAGVEFIDLATGRGTANHWVRGGCQYGVMPCNGLLYAPSHSCACYIQAKLSGFNALAPKRKEEAAEGGTEGRKAPLRARLEPGPAYNQDINPPSALRLPPSDDWPTYRHDPGRSGRTPSALPAALKQSWQADLGGRLSSVVIAQGKVFVAQIDEHTVHALDAGDGTTVWSYTVGGRVDSPPTVYRGLALFGSADGWVYCLRGSDGELVWRFRAGPEDLRLVAYGQLESAWPVHGSVLVDDGAACFVAGRSIFLDGGLYLYRLDPATGKILSQTRMDGRNPKTGRQPREIVRGLGMKGALPDVLSSDGVSIYMRHKRLNREFVEQEPNVPHLFSPAGFLDDSWWHRTYWIIGPSMSSGWGAWPNAGNRVPAGRLLVNDGATVYGFGRAPYSRDGSHVGLGKTHYRLFAADTGAQKVKPPAAKPASNPAARSAAAKKKPAVRYRWNRKVPFLVRALGLADKTLLLAGPPDGGDLKQLPAALEGRKGGLLWTVSSSNGKRLAELKLDSPPVFDGMAAANRRLFLSTKDGKVLCFGGR